MRRSRAAFTLTELLVALAVVLVLAGIAIVVVPGAITQDRTTDGAGFTRQYLMVAKGSAAKSGLPFGVRFIVATDPNNPAKSNANWVTEMQYIEAPPVLVTNPNQIGFRGGLNLASDSDGQPSGLPPVINIPSDTAFPGATALAQVRVEYVVLPPPTSGPPPPNPGAYRTSPEGRRIFLTNLTTDQLAAVQAGALLSIPEFNSFWGTFRSAATTINATTAEVFLDAASMQALDDYVGASRRLVSYRFGIYAQPQPLVGEPNLTMPKNICVDLSVSQPPYSAALGTPDYDVLFLPNGQVMNRSAGQAAGGQMFLWVRDYTKAANPLVQLSAGPPITYDMTVFRSAGEQQVVALKTKSGSLGTFPILWPNESNGQYIGTQDPFTFARQAATAPAQ